MVAPTALFMNPMLHIFEIVQKAVADFKLCCTDYMYCNACVRFMKKMEFKNLIIHPVLSV